MGAGMITTTIGLLPLGILILTSALSLCLLVGLRRQRADIHKQIKEHQVLAREIREDERQHREKMADLDEQIRLAKQAVMVEKKKNR